MSGVIFCNYEVIIVSIKWKQVCTETRMQRHDATIPAALCKCPLPASQFQFGANRACCSLCVSTLWFRHCVLNAWDKTMRLKGIIKQGKVYVCMLCVSGEKKNRGGAIKGRRYDSALLWNIIQVTQTQVVFYSKKNGNASFGKTLKINKGALLIS